MPDALRLVAAREIKRSLACNACPFCVLLLWFARHKVASPEKEKICRHIFLHAFQLDRSSATVGPSP